MYTDFYGLDQRPFLLSTDPGFLYWSESHSLAITMLRYGLMSGAPLSVVTGDVGAGKTTLLRHLMAELEDDVVVGLVSNMQPGHGDLIQWVMMAFGQEIREGESYVRSFQRFQDFVIETYAGGKRAILIVDEAQNLPTETLEELRMLSNINAEKDELLQIVLIGQPQLRELLNRPELEQFVQRIAADFHLDSLDREETHAYIHHRLKVAGADRQIFEDRTCDLIHEATGGVPRLINTLCDFCLVYGFSAERERIDEDTVRELLSGVRRHGIFAQFKPLTSQPTLVRDAKRKAGSTGDGA